MSKLNSHLIDEILNGRDIREALFSSFSSHKIIKEATLSNADVNQFIRSSYYKNISNFARDVFHKVEDAPGYRRNVWAKDPLSAVQDEIDEFFYAINNLKNIKIVGYPEEIKNQIEGILKTAERSYKRVLIKLKQNDTPEKVVSAFQPLFYSKKTLTLLTDFFTTLNIDWDYIWPWYNTPKEPPSKEKEMAFEISVLKKFYGLFEEIYELNDLAGANEIISSTRDKISNNDGLVVFDFVDQLFK